MTVHTLSSEAAHQKWFTKIPVQFEPLNPIAALLRQYALGDPWLSDPTLKHDFLPTRPSVSALMSDHLWHQNDDSRLVALCLDGVSELCCRGPDISYHRLSSVEMRELK